MFNSINTATTGLVGFSNKLQNISNNVSNLNTAGYKGSRTDFSSLFSDGGSSAQKGQGGDGSGSGVGTLASVINFSQGQINQTGNALDVAVNGAGFFVVRTDSGEILYTRAGQFSFNADGVLVNSQGHHVQALNEKGMLEDITLNGARTKAASASSTITMSGTLSTAGTDKLVGGIVVTDSAGGTHPLSVNFHNNTSATPGSWTVTITDGATTVGTGEVRFANGLLDPAFSSFTFTYSPAGAAAMPLTLKLDPSSTSPGSGNSTMALSSVDGFGVGNMTKTTFDSEGNLVISYSNSQTVKHQALALATFDSTADLHPLDGNSFVSTNQSGVHLGQAGTDGTTISPDSLEASNVDLSTEFSQIILTQRGYQAASEVISTANQMLDALMQMKG